MEEVRHELPGLREYLAILWQRKRIIIVVTAVTVAAAYFYTARLTPLYTSSSRVQVLVQTPGFGDTPVYLNIETEKELATSPVVAEIAMDLLEGETSTEELLGGLTVEVLTDTEILVFSYTDTNPKTTQERAQAFAEGYLAYRRQQVINQSLEVAQALQEEIDNVEEQIERVNEKLSLTDDETQEATLEAQRNALAGQLGVLQQEVTATPRDFEVGQVVQDSFLPTSPAGKNFARNLGLALFLGLALGMGLAFIAERLDDRLRGRHDLERHTTAPVLAVVPRMNGWKRREDTVLAVVSEPDSPASEAYRTLRTGVLFAASQRKLKTILITSSASGEGKTTTAANLGIALARAGKRVVLVSADLRKPRLQEFFNVQNGFGLTNVLAGERTVTQALAQPRGFANLKLMPSGPVPGNPAELLTSNGMRAALADLEKQGDFVLIDTAPVLVVADALVLTRLVDAVILVADAQRTSKAAVDQARHQLHQVDARIIGSVLNNLDPRKASGYYAYGGYSSLSTGD